MVGEPKSLRGGPADVNAAGRLCLDAQAYEALARALSGGGDAVARTVSRLAVERLGAGQALVLARKPGSERLGVVGSVGLDEAPDRTALLRLARRLVEWMERTRKPLTVQRPQADPRFPAVPGVEGPVRAFPLAGDRGLLGSFTVFDTAGRHALSDVDRGRWFLLLAAAVGTALREERVKTLLRRARRELRESERRRLQAERLAVGVQLTEDMAREAQVAASGLHRHAEEVLGSFGKEDPRSVALEAMVEEASHAARVLADLVALAHTAQPELRPEDLNRLLRECLLLVEPEIQRRKLRVTRRMAADLPPLLLDASLMRRLFVNLLRYGVERSEPGGRIKVESKRRGDALEVLLAMDVRREPGQVLEEMWAPFRAAGTGGEGVSISAVERILRERAGTEEA